MSSNDPDLSVVVPVYNEEETLPSLVEAVRAALGDGYQWELVLVDDGSRDRTAALAARFQRADPRVRLVQLARNYGQTTAMQAGFDEARGRVVVSMDGDLQNDPLDIPRVVAKLDEGFDLVAGYREHRRDKLLTRKVPSWIANRIIRRITGVNIRDNGGSLKGYRRELLDRMHLYSDMHRFIPAVAAATAGARISEIPVRHHARRFGQSKYGLTRVAKVLADLLTILMIRSFRERPLALFALGAAGAAAVALVFAVAALGVILLNGLTPDHLVVLPGAALLCLGLAVYLLMLGLVGEIALRERHAWPDVLPLVREHIA
jgi:glycosyltransferase involved in cell wall biosynthesis